MNPRHRDLVLTACAIAFAGVMAGSASALFLWLLDRVTAIRQAHPAIAFGLPLAGLVIGYAYQTFGRPIEGGSTLVVRTRRQGGEPIAWRMAPMVMAGTLVTHLFGGSAGREGTGVQMAASLADTLFHRWRIAASLRQHVLAAGVAAGFGSIFGTPVAGAIFAIEVTRTGFRDLRLVPSALIASVIGDRVSLALGIHHSAYPRIDASGLSFVMLSKWLIFGTVVAFVVFVFISLVDEIKRFSKLTISSLPLRMAIGGTLVVIAWRVVGTDEYLGIGVDGIMRAFTAPQGSSVFAIKLLFTAVTLGFGFIGGEVTPLFFVGATLGSALAQRLGLPIELGAGVGMTAMFGSASKAPLALTIMAAELMGLGVVPTALFVTSLATFLTARRSIYEA